MQNTLLNPQDFQLSVLNHTALQLAGLNGEAHVQALQQRAHQIIGMLELARRLGNDELVHALEAHHQALVRMIATA